MASVCYDYPPSRWPKAWDEVSFVPGPIAVTNDFAVGVDFRTEVIVDETKRSTMSGDTCVNASTKVSAIAGCSPVACGSRGFGDCNAKDLGFLLDDIASLFTEAFDEGVAVGTTKHQFRRVLFGVAEPSWKKDGSVGGLGCTR